MDELSMPSIILRTRFVQRHFPEMENILPSTVKHVSKELHELVNNPPEGIHVTLNEADMTDIQAVIEGPEETPYVGGQFRIRMVLSQSYPREPPKGFFITKIFHPNIQPTTGEICVNTMKRDWRPNLGIKHLMLTIKCLLIVPNPESALNEEAGRLLLEEYDEYARRARLFTDIHARVNLLEQKKCGNQTTSALSKTGNSGDGVDSVAILRDSSHNTEGPLAKKRAGEKDGVVAGGQGVPGSSAPGSTSSGVAAVKKSAASKKSLRRL